MKNIHRIGPPKPDSLVILLHGYGANGQDLIGLGEAWRGAMPNTAFVSPDAPTLCEMGGGGFQWWTLADGISPVLSGRQADALITSIAAFITGEAGKAGVPLSRVALVGFSQGGMLAMHVGLRMSQPLACIVGLSCLLLPAAGPVVSRTPVLMCHGVIDPIVPFAMFEPSVNALRQQGVAVETFVRQAMGHQIDMETLTTAGRFIAGHLK